MKNIDVKLIEDVIKDMVVDFIYYDRKEDKYLRLGDIEYAISNNLITFDEIISIFENKLKSEVLGKNGKNE